MSCHAQIKPPPTSEKEYITFCKIGPAHEPNTGEKDEQAELFGQGRSPERQAQNSRVMTVLTLVLGVAVFATGFMFLPQ